VPTADCKRRAVTKLQVHVLNPPIRALAAHGLVPSIALLETTGRRSGQPRRTPVTNGLQRGSDTFWLVAEHGRNAAYVRNIVADPHVRVRIGRRWRTGIGHVLDDDDPIARQRTLPRVSSAAVRALGSALVTVRIDLDP
jgi:deazaflavin-dependent oxidoreductase (nitroreductase family)